MRKFLFGFMVVALGCGSIGCQSPIQIRPDTSITPNPRGTREEQIAYLQAQIRRYQAAADRESQAVDRAIRKGNIAEARQAEARRDQYMRKIERRQREIDRLKAMEE